MYKEEVLKLFSKEIRAILERTDLEFALLQEIRLRINRPLMVIYQGHEYFIKDDGTHSTSQIGVYSVTAKEIKATMEYISNYSLYAYEEEIRQGFITIQGGHRVGIAGKTVIDGNRVKGIKYISFINIRFSHQIKGCADKVLPYVSGEHGIHHTLIISSPRCGKTTLLRDLIRQLSDGKKGQRGYTVGVVDERSEIGGCYLGIPQNDVGIRTDVLDCCPKAEGMMMLVRSMSPAVIAVDEIGNYEDINAIESVIHCGCKLLATVHGNSMEDIRKKPLLERLVNERIFERYILLHNKNEVGEVKSIFDERGTCLYSGEMNLC